MCEASRCIRERPARSNSRNRAPQPWRMPLVPETAPRSPVPRAAGRASRRRRRSRPRPERRGSARRRRLGLPPLPIALRDGERAGVRGGNKQRPRLPPPLTPTLSPQAGRGNGAPPCPRCASRARRPRQGGESITATLNALLAPPEALRQRPEPARPPADDGRASAGLRQPAAVHAAPARRGRRSPRAASPSSWSRSTSRRATSRTAIAELVAGVDAARAQPGAARRHRLGQDLHHGAGDRARRSGRR